MQERVKRRAGGGSKDQGAEGGEREGNRGERRSNIGDEDRFNLMTHFDRIIPTTADKYSLH